VLEVQLLVHHRLLLGLRIVLLRLFRMMAMTNPMVIIIATLRILSVPSSLFTTICTSMVADTVPKKEGQRKILLHKTAIIRTDE
jgi:hypothetical protein